MSEKKLLILGYLKHHSMHGYQLAQMLDMGAFSAIKLSKANAYKLLDSMEHDGWVAHETEENGSRPSRRIYRVTSSGEEAYASLLVSNLKSDKASEHPWLIGFDFLHALPPEKVIQSLNSKRQQVEQRLAQFHALSEEQLEQHPSISFLKGQVQWELDWLDSMLNKWQQGG